MCGNRKNKKKQNTNYKDNDWNELREKKGRNEYKKHNHL